MALINSRFSKTISLLISVWILYGGLPVCTQAAIEYKVIDLGTFGGDRSVANFINSTGQIVGWASTSQGFWHAATFDVTEDGKSIDLGTLSGDWSMAHSINSTDRIVGWAHNEQAYQRATIFNTMGTGNNIDLGTLGGNESRALSINDTGLIVGEAINNQGRWRATLFDPTGSGNNIDLGTIGSYESWANSINSMGRIVGAEANNSEQWADYHAILFDPTVAGDNIDLGTLGGDWSMAYSINDANQIVGAAQNSFGYWRATLFDPTGAANNIDLGTFGGDESRAYSINNNGQIVGGASEHAILFDITGTGKNIDLNTLIDPNCGWVFMQALCINDTGWIVGDGWNPEGELHAFLLIPQSSKYSGGTGEPNDPYQIATADDLILLGENPGDYDKHFIMTADIDLDPNLPGRKVFDRAVIDTFTGIFDGNSHVISNLWIKGIIHLGLFGQLASGAKISNLGLESANVEGTSWYVGGLVGENYGSITACYSTGIVTGVYEVGGLVGRNSAGNIIKNYSTVVATGGWSVGGLVGGNWNGSITTSYSTGMVTGNKDVGGLVGNNYNGSITLSFWDINASSQTISGGGTGMTTAEMQSASTFLEAGWDFVSETINGPNDIWKMWDGYDYPRLAWEPGPNTPLVFVGINDPGFYGQMSKYEVTNAQYCDFLNAALASGDITIDGNDVYGACGSNSGEDYAGQRYYRCDGSGYTGYGATNGGASRIHYSEGEFGVDEGFGNHPVTYVSWYGAIAFANYYGYYLPTEEQWQAVADYDGTYIYGCGQIINPGIANYRYSEHPDGTTSVGSFGIYGYGMSDMAGNVWEWTSSSLGDNRVFRGGSMGSIDSDCAVSIRGDGIPYTNYWDVGFRVCR